jgi:hypothetical protein
MQHITKFIISQGEHDIVWPPVKAGEGRIKSLPITRSEIKDKGDKVIIRTIADVTVNDYVKGQDLDIENPESPPLELLIDNAHYFNVALDDIDAYQTDIELMESWSKDATEKMRNKQDVNVLTNIAADVDDDNMGTTAGKQSASYDLGATSGNEIVVTASDVLDLIVDMGSVLDEADIPSENRWIVAPAWFTGMIKKSDLQDASITGDGKSILRNGRIGMIDRFTIYMSNNLPGTTDATADSGGGATCWNIMAGHKSALTYASQIVKVQRITSERTFASLLRGLQVYGYKVVVPEAMALLYARKG